MVPAMIVATIILGETRVYQPRARTWALERSYRSDRVAVRRYENAKGTVLRAKVWQLATPADAYRWIGRAQGIFFHQGISIQSELWLGGENLLGLGPETDGILARYEVVGAVARLLLVQYSGAEVASAGLTALEGSPIGGLVTANVHDALLGAVFGEVDVAEANTLLSETLRYQ
jgi:hypothetical protein